MNPLPTTQKNKMALGQTALGQTIRAAKSSLAGLKAVFANEAAFRQELLLIICLVTFALRLGKTGLEKAVLLASLLLVLIVELLRAHSI